MPEPPTSGRSSALVHVLAFVLLWAGVQLFAVGYRAPEVLQGAQIDTDGYLRLVRVERLVETGAWFDGSIPRSNWPYGEDHHWTRPLDVLIMGLAAPLLPFLSLHDAVAVAGALVSPLLQLLACLALVWTVRPLVPGATRFLAMPALLVQTGVLAYGMAGRADHHILILLLTILSLGAWIRALLAPERGRAALAAGALAGLGLWVSPETLLPIGLLFLSGGLAWALCGARFAAANLRLCAGLLVATAGAIVVERPASTWAAAELDRISGAHLTMAALALLFWWLVGRGLRAPEGEATGTRRPSASRRSRLLVGALGAAAALGLMALAHPRFFRGPWADVDPEVIQVWLDYVRELKPAFPQGADDIGTFLVVLGPAFVLIPFAVSLVVRERSTSRGPVWILLLAALLLYVPLAAAQFRFAAQAGVIFAVLTVVLLDRLLPRLANLEPPWRRRLARAGAMAGLLVGFIGVGQVVDLTVQQATDNPAKAARDTEGSCDLARLAPVLDEPAGRWPRPATIAAFIDFGPELLYRTRHRVLAGPYHRNRDGILAAYRLLASRNPAESRRIAAEREVDLILLCPPKDRFYFDRDGSESLYRRLLDGEPPSWIRRADLAPDAGGDFVLFEVTAADPPAASISPPPSRRS